MQPINCFILMTTLQIPPLLAQDLKSIFHIPSRRNYDDLEILERSNFNDDSAPSTSPTPLNTDTPRSYANAQVMLRFGSDSDKNKCACGDVCQCKNQPQYIPVITPLPYCCCVPPYYYAPPTTKPPCGGEPSQNILPPPPCHRPFSTQQPPTATDTNVYQVTSPTSVAPVVEVAAPKPKVHRKKKNVHEHNEVIIGQNDNVVDEQTKVFNNVIQQNIEINNNHPEILETVTLPEDSIKSDKCEDITTVKCLEEVSNKLEPSELSPNVKIVSLDLSKVPKTCKCCEKVPKTPKNEIDECVISYTSPKQPQPKLLLTYPIFNRPDPELAPTRPSFRPFEPTNPKPNFRQIQEPAAQCSKNSEPAPARLVFRPFEPTIPPRPTYRQVQEPVVQYSQSGYSVSEGSGFYSDPSNTVIYRKPTVVQIVPPQTRIIRPNKTQYVCVPVVDNAPGPHTEDCCCCSCAKYVGEMNEQEQAV